MGRSKRTGPGLEQQACSILDLRSLILLTEAHTTRIQFNRKSAFSRQSKIRRWVILTAGSVSQFRTGGLVRDL